MQIKHGNISRKKEGAVAGTPYRAPQWVGTLLWSALVIGGLCSASLPVQAQAVAAQAAQDYRIAAGPLGQVLAEFAAQAGVTLSTDAALTRGLQSPGLAGGFTVEAGFARLLEGTRLEALRNAQGQYVLVAPASLQPVIVTSTRTEHDLMDIPLSVSVVGGEDFTRMPNSNVGDQLLAIPGVQLGGANVAGDRRIMIRGHSAGATLLLVDGIRQPEIRNTAGAGFTINTADIERIEVIKGPASVLYGSDAIGGVINIITKKGGPEPLGGSIGLIADSSTDSFDPRLSLYGSSHGLYYRVTGSGLNADDRKAGDNVTLFNSSYRQRSVRGLVGYEWDNGSLQFTAERFRGSNNYTPVIADADGRYRPADPAERTTISEVPKNDRDAYVLALDMRDLGENLVGLKSNVYYQKLDKGFDYYSYRTGVYSGRHLYRHEAWGGSLQTDWAVLDDHLLSVGLDFDHIRMDKHDYLPVHNVSEGILRTTALFAQDEWSLTPDLTFTAGVRQTWIRTSLDRDTANPDRVDSKSYSNVVSSMGLVYRGIEDVALRALFSQGFKAPNLTQMMIGSGVIIPNPDLKPEKSNNFELGARYSGQDLNVDFTLYHSTFRNGILNEIVSTGPTRWQAYNVDRARSWGAELAADYTFGRSGFSVYGNLNLLRYETEDKNGFKTRHSSRSPAWGTLGVGWEKTLSGGRTLFADFNAMAGKGAYTLQANGNVKDRTSSWYTLNTTVGLAGGKEHEYSVTLSLRNLLDRSYQIASPFSPSSPLPEPGFHAVLGVNVAF